MGTYCNDTTYPLCADTQGHTLAPGEHAELDDNDPTVNGLTEAGRLRLVTDTGSVLPSGLSQAANADDKPETIVQPPAEGEPEETK